MENALPPHSLEAEKAVLGGILYDPESIVKVKPTLEFDDFYHNGHQRIYAAMLDVYGDGLTCDLVTVNACLIDKKEISKVGGPAYLAELCETVPSAAYIEQHVRIVKEKATLRRIIEQAQEIIKQTLEPGTKPDAIPTRLSIETSKTIS